MKTGLSKTMLMFVLLVGMAPAVQGDDSEVLSDLVQNFLANASVESAHQDFWSDDLVYTSSNGTRFGKADILAGFDETETQESAPAISYTGEDIDVRIYDDFAVVVFRLVGTPTDKSSSADVLYYFNTGTFQKQDGVWRVVAWQATAIPSE